MTLVSSFLLQSLFQSHLINSWQAGGIVLAAIVAWSSNALEVFNVSQFSAFVVSGFGIKVGIVGVALVLSRLQRRDILSVNRGAMIKSISDSILVLDADVRIAELNPAAERLLGESAAETIGLPLEQVWPELRAECDSLLEGSKAVSMQYRNQLHTFDISISPMRDRHNRLVSRVIVLHDITERKASELALQASRDYAMNIIDSSLDMIIAVDMERCIIEFNRAAEETFGYSRDEVLGKSVNLLYADLAEGEKIHQRMTLGGRNISRILNKTKSGRVFPSLLSSSILRDLQGSPIGYMGISRDITELENAEEEQRRLYGQVRTGRERLQLLSKQLLDAQESERRRIARELHDVIGQAMTGVQMTLQGIGPVLTDADARSQLEDAMREIEHTLQQVRNLSLDLRPSILDDFGLVPALRWWLERQAKRSGLDIQFSADPFEKRAPEQVETVCFRVTQEAITNITRHAHAKHVFVQFSPCESDLSLTIQDDGIGFDAKGAIQRAAQGSSMGLLGMQERVLLVGGRLDISSAPNQGTRIQVIVPFDTSTPYEERRSRQRRDNETNSRSVSG